jgi:hypothetical protein
MTPDDGRLTESQIRDMCARICKEMLEQELGPREAWDQIHRYMLDEMERRRRREEMIRRVQTSVIGSLIITMIGGVFYLVGQAAILWMRGFIGRH